MLLPLSLCIISCFIQEAFQANVTPKCCGKNMHVQELENRTLECIEKSNTRYQIWSRSYDFLNRIQETGECIEWNGQALNIYTVNSSMLVSKTTVSTPAFPKCCPLDHAYSNQTRSCVKSEENFIIEGQIVSVGLPHCKVIIDKNFENESEAFSWAKESSDKGQYCLDRDVDSNPVVRVCQEGLTVCEKKRCFKKCCPDGQSYVGGGICMDTFVHGIRLDSQGYSDYIEDLDDDFELIYGAGCPMVSIYSRNTIQYNITKTGQFRYYHNFSEKFLEHNYTDFSSYCLEHATKGNMSGYFLFMCIKQTPLAQKFTGTLWAKILSCVLLLVTIAVYIYLGEIKSNFGKILTNYCLAMIFLMVTLAEAHMVRMPTRLQCKITGYLLIFFNMSAVAWVNVMSIDIWWTFGTSKRIIGSDQKKKDLKKFIIYFAYGWGIALCHTLLILFFETTAILPEPIQPYVGIFKCFLENRNYARTVLFLIPQMIFQIINTVLFVKTVVYCIRVKNEINKMNDSMTNKDSSGRLNADKERLGLIVKLAVIMGILWIFEVITAFFENLQTYSEFTKILETILDNVTCLQGLFIFLIFICKKKTLNTLKTKLGLGERRFSHSLSVTQSSHMHGHFPMNKRQTTMSITETKM